MSLAFIPFYIHFMGIESYGLVGFYTALQGALMLLDFGFSTTMNREMARFSAQPEKAQEARDQVRTLEVIYWGIGIVILAGILAGAPLIARYWVKADRLSVDTLRQVVMIMGVVSALQWPISFYTGGLMGLQRQVLLNGINATMATVRGLGAVLILWLVSPTILAFFAWQIITSALHTLLLTFSLWRCLPSAEQPPRFQKKLLLTIWHFAAGMSAISVVTLVLTQMDKVILSNLLTLKNFGYYALASVVANGLSTLFGPIFTAVFPSFSRLVVLGDQVELKQLYHRSCQMVSVVVLPVAVVIVFFSPEILWLWTGDTITVENTYWLVRLLVIGSLLNGLMHLPYALQLAHGWTRLTFYSNLAAVIALVPLLVWLAPSYGALGAAAVWVALNAGYVLVSLQFMHHRLLRGELWRWYIEDVGLPLLAALLLAGLGRGLLISQLPKLAMLLYLGFVTSLAFLASGLSASHIRKWIFSRLTGADILAENLRWGAGK